MNKKLLKEVCGAIIRAMCSQDGIWMDDCDVVWDEIVLSHRPTLFLDNYGNELIEFDDEMLKKACSSLVDSGVACIVFEFQEDSEEGDDCGRLMPVGIKCPKCHSLISSMNEKKRGKPVVTLKGWAKKQRVCKSCKHEWTPATVSVS